MKALCTGCVLWFVLSGCVMGLTQPDISAIGDFRAFSGNFKNPDGTDAARNGTWNMRFQELELAVNGNLNPYARADLFVAHHGDGFEIEEAYATILRGLLLNAQIRAGKYLVDFGKLNQYHPHAFPFVDRPIVDRVYFGFDGFADEGINLSFLLPTSFYSKLSLNVLRGRLFDPDAHAHGEETGEQEEHAEGRNTEDPIFSGRLSFFVPVGANGNLEFGASGLHGKYAGAGAEGTGDEVFGFEDMFATMYGLDAKYKHRWSDYTSLTLQGELVGSRRDRFFVDPFDEAASGTFDKASTLGGFAFADLRFWKRHNVGVIFDYAPGVFDYGEEDYSPIEDEFNNTSAAVLDDENHTTAVTVFTGFSLMEETTLLRVIGRWTSFDITDRSRLVNTSLVSKDDEFTIAAQLIWSLGPHKPHEF